MFNLYEVKSRKETTEKRSISWAEVSRETGIRHNTLLNMANNEAKRIAPEHLSALCVYFGVGIGDVLTPADVALPLAA